jgi:hypothetical protein
MTRLRIIFHNLIERLRYISIQGPSVDLYLQSLNETKRDSFIFNAEQVSAYVSEIENCYRGNTIPNFLGDVIYKISEIKRLFPDFPNNRYNEVLLMLEIVNKINYLVEGIEDFNLELEVDTDVFSLLTLTTPIRNQFFYYFDSSSLDNSVLLFDLNNPEELFLQISQREFSIEILLHLLSKLGLAEPISLTAQYLLAKSGLSQIVANAYIKLHIVRNGGYFHNPRTYIEPINVHPERTIVPLRQYQQFHDALYIISEYNYQNDILDKYLRIYHVIENFMFRTPLVELGINNAGIPFSIRDFARLYKQVNLSEEDVLKKLFDYVLLKNYCSTPITFCQFIVNKWNSLCPAETTPTNINLLLSFLRVNNSRNLPILFENIKNDTLKNIFYKLVYNFRNSIVHNKDTELHLTHETLVNHPVMHDTASILLEKFLIPCLEEIVFYLIIEQNEIVWYRHSKLVLWDEGLVV